MFFTDEILMALKKEKDSKHLTPISTLSHETRDKKQITEQKSLEKSVSVTLIQINLLM